MRRRQMRAIGTALFLAFQIAIFCNPIVLAQNRGDVSSDSYLRRGDAWSDKGDYDRAIADYNEAIRRDSKNVIAYFSRAYAWSGKGDYDKAISDYDQALGLDPKNASAYFNRAIAWNNKGNYDKAIADYDQAIRLDPKDASAYYSRGNAWGNKGDYDKAISDYDQALRLDPKNASAYFNRGRAWNNKGNYDKAIPDYDQAIRLDPQDASAYYDRAYAWSGKGDYDRAIADYDQAIRLDPKYAAAYKGRSDVWRARSQPDRAIADALQAIRLDPNNGDYHGTLSSAYQEKQDFERALAAAAEAIRLNPKDYISFGNRGTVWRDVGELDKAIADYNEAIRLKPDYDKPYSNRGDIWRLQGDLNRALADHDQAVRLNGNDTTNYVFRADTLRYKGEFARALADYDSALRVQPGEISAYTGRGLTFEKMGDPTKARAEFEKALASKSQQRSDINREALETARARLAALNSGAIQPVIPAAPSKAASANSIPTPAAVVPAAVFSAAKQGRRVALVIGNSAYKNVPALTNPQRDADAIAASLRAIGFDTVTLVKDSNREGLTTALRDFAGEAEKAEWAVVYYAGHGMEVNGTNYLIPVEARIAADRDIQSEAVPLDQVMAAVDAAKKLKLVLLDACRDNPFVPQMRKTAPDAVAVANRTAGGVIGTRSVSRGLGEVRVSGATLVVYAAKHGQVALDGEGGNSPFAVAVVQRLATPNVEINKLFRLVRDDVMEATAGRQEPYTYGSLPGREDFFFAQR
jgi:tetratricopeptide (TPR) repeat protein